MIKNYKFRITILILVLLVIAFEFLRSSFTKLGDFKGYALVGNLVLNGLNIYKDPLINTWPPFFSLVTVPIAVIDNLSQQLVRLIWQLGSIFALYKSINLTTQLTLNKKLTFSFANKGELINKYQIHILNWIILVPLLIILRQVWSNLGNIQINIYMLLMALLSVYYFTKNKNILAALILGFSISIKVYTIFLLLYFVIKRQYKIVGYTLLFIVGFAMVPFFVYGYEQTLSYYVHWYTANIEPFALINHKNQSFFSLVRSLLAHESPGMAGPLKEAIYLNVMNLPLSQIKLISYAIVAIAALPVIWLFKDKLIDKGGLKSSLEYGLILTIIPILSPLSWKSYFIFLYPGFFISYLLIFRANNSLKKSLNLILRACFYIAIILTVFSSELFVGNRISDIMEVFSCYTIGTILLVINILIIYTNFNKFILKTD